MHTLFRSDVCLLISFFFSVNNQHYTLYELRHDKTNKVSVRPAKTQISLGIRPVWSDRVFAVRMKKPWAISYPLSAQRRLWSDWADAQADLSLRWAHTPFLGFCHAAAHMHSCNTSEIQILPKPYNIWYMILPKLPKPHNVLLSYNSFGRVLKSPDLFFINVLFIHNVQHIEICLKSFVCFLLSNSAIADAWRSYNQYAQTFCENLVFARPQQQTCGFHKYFHIDRKFVCCAVNTVRVVLSRSVNLLKLFLEGLV